MTDASPDAPPDLAEDAPAVAPTPSRLARARAQVTKLGDRVEEAAERIPAIDAVLQTQRHDAQVAGNILASAVAYRLFLWILPLSLVLAATLGFVRAAGPEDPADAAEELGLSAYVASSVADAASQAERSRWILLVVGLVALYSASAGAAKTLVTVHALVWGVPIPKPKAAWRRALGFVLLALGCVGLAALTHVLQNRSVDRIVLTELLVLAVIAGFGLLMMWVLPHGDVPWIRLLPGTAVIAVGVVALRLVTALYIVGRIQSSSELYGGLGAAAAILLWLYLIGRMVVGAAVLNATLWERHRSTHSG